MTNEDMLYTSVWEKLCDSLLANTRPPIEEAALHWAVRKVRGYQELYEAVMEQTEEIDELKEINKDLELDLDDALDKVDELRSELDRANDHIETLNSEIEDLENELQEAREPEVD